MPKISNIFKKKKALFSLVVVFLVTFVALWNVVSGGYDRQNKAILFIKKFVPPKISRQIRDFIFVIPDLKQRNKFLTTQVNKYEQGMEGQVFHEEILISHNNKKEYFLREFFLPFPRFDPRLGWGGKKNSSNKHYLGFFKDKVIVVSGKGRTIYFEKKNFLNKKLSQIEIENNINILLEKNNSKLIGVRDLFIEDKKIYISIIFEKNKKISINAYRADLNIEKLNFELFFETNEYWDTYNVYSGGRFSKYKDGEILFTIGFAAVKNAAQQMNSLLGKIISINKSTGLHKIISIGHRNPQGIYYIKKLDIIINTEHGPKGGDEININFQEKNVIPNFGWDIASYGKPYLEEPDLFKKSHKEYGFVEPFKYYTPSIGISQLLYMKHNLDLEEGNHLFVTSLRACSIYVIKFNEELNEITNEDRIYIHERRIRDIAYDKKNNVFFLIFENTPSIGILSTDKLN